MTRLFRKRRLAFVLGAVGLVLSGIGLALAHLVVEPHLRATVEQDLRFAAEQLSQKLDRGMFERWQDITLGARREVLRNRAGGQQEAEVVNEIKARHPRYAWVGFTDENCIVRVSTESSLKGLNVEARPWCGEARKGAFVGDIHEAVLLKSRLPDIGAIGLLMDIAVPVRGSENRVTGVLAAHLMADWLIDAVRSPEGPRQVKAAVVTSQNQVVLASGLLDKPLASGALSGLRAGPHSSQWPDGEFLAAGTPAEGLDDFPGFGWTAVARIAVNEARAPWRRTLHWVLGGGLAVTMLLFAAGLVLGRRIGAQASEPSPDPSPIRPTVPLRDAGE